MVGIRRYNHGGANAIRPFFLEVLKTKDESRKSFVFCPQKKGYRLTGLARLAVLFFFKSLY